MDGRVAESAGVLLQAVSQDCGCGGAELIPALIVFLALGQQVAPKPCVGGAPPKNDPDCIPASILSGTAIVSSVPIDDLRSGIETSEIVTKDGHYVWKFEDRHNIYRCQVVSVVDPHNAFRDAPAFMVACFLVHEVEKQP